MIGAKIVSIYQVLQSAPPVRRTQKFVPPKTTHLRARELKFWMKIAV
jgi:hypothetical protein